MPASQDDRGAWVIFFKTSFRCNRLHERMKQTRRSGGAQGRRLRAGDYYQSKPMDNLKVRMGSYTSIPLREPSVGF